jgi:hypothetical protein
MYNFKKAVFTAIACISMLTAYAQNGNDSERNYQSKFGIKGGLNVSRLGVSNDRVEEEKLRVGGNAGLFAYVSGNKLFGLQIEAQYSGKGAGIKKFKDSYGVTTDKVNFNLHYIEVPVFLKVNLGPIGLGAGVYAAYLMKANVSRINYRDDVPTVQRYNLNEDDFHRVDVGGLLDLSVNVKAVSIGARYTAGFEKLANTTAGNLFIGDSKNNVGSLYLAFGF